MWIGQRCSCGGCGGGGRGRSGEAHHLSHGLGDFLRQRSCVLPSYKTWQMHLGSLWAGSKKLPALGFLQVFMLGNDVFNFLKIFIYGVCLCTHTCVCCSMCVEIRGQLYRRLFSPSTTWVPGIKSGCQDWQQVPFPAEPSYQPRK